MFSSTTRSVLSRCVLATNRRYASMEVLSSEHVVPSLTTNKQIVQRIMSGEHTPALEKNIIHSSTERGWSHLELTSDQIRIEYDSITPGFVESAQLYFDTEDELVAKGIPLCFKPTKVENKTAIGAGATVYLDRHEIADYLRDYGTLLPRTSTSHE